MKRALSQPFLWIRSPSSPRDRSGTDLTPNATLKPSVHWERPSFSGDESPGRLAGNSVMSRLRKYSTASPSLFSSRAETIPEPASSSGECECGSFVKSNEGEPLELTCTETLPSLEKRGMQYVGLFAGRSSPQCAKFLAENLQTHIAEAIDRISSTGKLIENWDAILAEAFKTCDQSFDGNHPRDPSGSCALISVIQERSLHIAWAGEARGILCCGNDVKATTWDHQPTNESEKKRILSHGGLIASGQILGVLASSRGFGENDVKSHFSDGVFISRPTVMTWKAEEDHVSVMHSPSSHKPWFLILASHHVFSVIPNEIACSIVNKALHQHDYNPDAAAERLAKHAFRKCQKACSVVVVVLGADSLPRSRSSSLASWRSLRSFSTHETDPAPSPRPDSRNGS